MPIYIPKNRLRLNKALDWFHTGHPDNSGFDWIAERTRHDHPVRWALVDGTLKSWALTEQGEQFEILPEHWAGMFLWPGAYSSSLENVSIGNRIVAGYLVVDAEAFASLLRADDVAATIKQTPTPFSYMPPYLAYMLDLVERYDISSDYKFNKNTMVRLIVDDKEGRSKDLDVSLNKAKMIATFLGNPEFEVGGNSPMNSSSRDPDPRKPFNGVSYPKPRRRP